MKCKLLTILVVSVFFISVFGAALAQTECPECNGIGKIRETVICPTCGGVSTAQAIVQQVGTIYPSGTSRPSGPATQMKGVFHNDGASDVYGTITATINTQAGDTLTNTSSRTFFPAGEDVTVTIIIEEIRYGPELACFMAFDGAETATCPTCNGLGYITVSEKTCTACGGTGVISNGIGGNFNLEGVGGAVAGVVVIGAVVAVGFVVVKKRRVSEQSLRRLSSFEFQDWVIKRISANQASQKDAYLGIDAYTAEGYPLQIRQDTDVGKRAIDSFAAAIARNKARTGTIIAFGFGNDALEGVSKARLNYKLDVKTVTVKELLARKDRTI